MAKPNIIFGPIKSNRSFEIVSEEIKSLILKGSLKIGDRLPSESELANQFQVGRQTIREALRILELSGFITIQQGAGGGPVIQETILDRISQLYRNAFQMERIAIEELTTARIEIEQVILKQAIECADADDIRALRENAAAARRMIDSGQIATQVNYLFHELLARASKNHVYVVVVKSILELHREHHTRLPPSLELSGNAILAHEALLEAIMAQDRDRAQKILTDHLKTVQDQMHSLPAVSDDIPESSNGYKLPPKESKGDAS